MSTREKAGFGWPGAGFGSGSDAGLGMGDALGAAARQYFDTVAGALRGAAGGRAAPTDPWRAVFDAWSSAAGGRSGFGEGMFGEGMLGQGMLGQGMFGGHGSGNTGFGDGLDAVVGRFATQGRQWFGRMQALVGNFSGRDAAPADIVQVWKSMLGGDAANPFADLFAQMGGRGHAGFDQWLAQAAPLLRAGWGDAFLREGSDWLSLPAFGPAREHQERGQALARAMIGLQQANDAYNALMLEAGREAFVRFERKLGERSEPGRQLKSARALFDLWVDAAEEAYAEAALSVEFRQRYAELVDAQMRVRAGVQDAVERTTALFGMPTRTEVDAAHRRIAQLERELRRLQRGGVTKPDPRSAPAASPRATTARASASADVSTASVAPLNVKTSGKPAENSTAKPRGRAEAKPTASKKADPAANAKGRAKKAATKGAKQDAKNTSKKSSKNSSKRKPPSKPAAARATNAPSRRASFAIAGAMPLAPEPLPSMGEPGISRDSSRRARPAARARSR